MLINRTWLENMKVLFNDLKTLGNSLQQQKVDYTKSYAHIPAIIDSLVKLWRSHGKYTAKSFVAVDVGEKGSQINILGEDCPARLQNLRKDLLTHCFDEQLKNGDYRLAFTEVNVDSYSPPPKKCSSYVGVAPVPPVAKYSNFPDGIFSFGRGNRTNLPFRGVGKDVLRVVDEETLAQTAECFTSKFCTRLHQAAKSWSNALKTSIAEELVTGKRTYAGRRHFSPMPKLDGGLQSFSDECHRFLSGDVTVTEQWKDKTLAPDIRKSQMALAQLVRTMKVCTQSMTAETLNKAYLHRKIAETYCEFDTRFNAVLSALPWQYLVDCRKAILEETQRSETIRPDTSKFQGLIKEAKNIPDLVEIIRSMSDIARLETDCAEIRSKYRTLTMELGDFKWEVLGEGTTFLQQ